MQILLTTTALVTLAEMGDKTQLLAFSLAARFQRPWAVMAGILVATLANHLLAAGAGAWVGAHVDPRILRWAVGGSFLVFALSMLVPDELDEPARERSAWGPFATTALLFFLAEMGDKTQLATVALAARVGSVPLVVAGTTTGMLLADGLAVAVGTRLPELLPMKWTRRIGALLFAILGVVVLAWG
jgi:putative Ca2+/H+ antiporter (TMEM165/GDT1 family)